MSVCFPSVHQLRGGLVFPELSDSEPESAEGFGKQMEKRLEEEEPPAALSILAEEIKADFKALAERCRHIKATAICG